MAKEKEDGFEKEENVECGMCGSHKHKTHEHHKKGHEKKHEAKSKALHKAKEKFPKDKEVED